LAAQLEAEKNKEEDADDGDDREEDGEDKVDEEKMKMTRRMTRSRARVLNQALSHWYICLAIIIFESDVFYVGSQASRKKVHNSSTKRACQEAKAAAALHGRICHGTSRVKK
jgi:hypothetical protein